MTQPFNKQYLLDVNTEFYTKEESVKRLIPFLDKSKRYIEPFDRVGNSKIYSVLKQEGFDIIRLQNNYNKEDNYDNRIIITNPPFISRAGLYSKMSKQCEEMFLIMPLFSFNCYTKNRGKDKCNRWSDNWEKKNLFPVLEFDTPDGTKKVSSVFSHWKKIRGKK